MAKDPTTKPRRIDWGRIERDYATGHFTDKELAQKHGTARAVITRKRSADRKLNPTAWPIDRSADVKRATAALLLNDHVTQTVARGNDAEAVLAAAHVIKDVILSHRSDLKRARLVTSALMAELSEVTTHRRDLGQLIERAAATMNDAEAANLAAQARELVKLHNRISSVQKLADAMARFQTQERRAFGISDDDKGESPLDTMNERELQAEIDRLGQQLGTGPYLAAVDGRSLASGG